MGTGDHSTTKSLILRRLNRDGANEVGFCEALHQKTVGNKDDTILAFQGERAGAVQKSGATPSDYEGVTIRS